MFVFGVLLKIIVAKQLNAVSHNTVTFKNIDLVKMSLDLLKILVSRHVYKSMQ